MLIVIWYNVTVGSKVSLLPNYFAYKSLVYTKNINYYKQSIKQI